VHGLGGDAVIRYDVIDFDGVPVVTELIPVPHMTMLHTFFVTENWVVFPVMPLELSLQRAMSGGPMTAWVPDRPSKLGLMPRRGTAADVRWIEVEARHMLHEANVWEQDGKIVADVAAAEGTALFPDIHGNRADHAETRQSLRRWTIDPLAPSDTLNEEIVNDRDIQFPRPDDRLMAQRSRHAFANSNLQSCDGRVEGMDSALRVDTVTGVEDLYHFGAGTAVGELIFAPRVGSTHELDGYAVTLVHRAGAAESELVVFDAADIAAGPIASAVIPFRIPSGFHCSYYSVDSPLYRQAFVPR
jgi:carotenoid cleavage dioxygenase